MHRYLCATTLQLLASSGALADVLGPVYPPPTDLSSNSSLVYAAWSEITSVLDATVNGSLDTELATSFFGADNVSMSVGVFSLDDPGAFETLQYHYTSLEVINGNGTDSIDADSIRGTASITKVFTAFAGLVQLTEEEWNRPLTQCIPGLAEYLEHLTTEDPITTIQWDEITPWALANQIAGVPMQPPQFDISFQSQIPGNTPASELGLPPVPRFESETTCISTCPQASYLESMQWYHPTRLPWSTSLYTNNGFVLLGFAIANITGKPMADVFNDAVFSPLGMTSTFAGPPTSEADLARSVRTDDALFLPEVDTFVSSGGIFSTLRDLATFGTSILNSTLLTPEATRRWLKPTSHTANLNYSVGAPWEIVRYTSPLTGKVTDLYAKSGQSVDINTHFVLIPDYNAGFIYLSSALNVTIGAGLIGPVLDLVTETLLPALEAQAAAEATANFAGTYTSTDPNLNSSVTITYNESTATSVSAALRVSSWTFNGTDMLETLFFGERPRLLMSIQDREAGKVAFYANARSSVPAGLFTGTLATNGDFFVLDGQRYGGVNLGLVVFEVDEMGRATGLQIAVTGLTLQRQSD